MRTSDHPPLLAFHSYPQLITVFFNRRVFGPPLCVTTTSSWPWIDRRVSGLLPATIRPIKTRFPYGSPIRLALLLRSKSLTHRSEEHTSELQSLMRISYAVFCLKKKRIYTQYNTTTLLQTSNEY